MLKVLRPRRTDYVREIVNRLVWLKHRRKLSDHHHHHLLDIYICQDMVISPSHKLFHLTLITAL